MAIPCLHGTNWLEKMVLQHRRASISDSEGPVVSVIIDFKGNCGNYVLFLLEGGVSFCTLVHSQGNVFNK